MLFFGLMSAPSALYDNKIITRVKINSTSDVANKGGDFTIGCILFTAEMSTERKKRDTREDDWTNSVYSSSSFSGDDDDDEEEEEVEKQEESSYSSVQSQHESTTSHYSEPTSAFKVASGNALQALLSRIKVLNLELYRRVSDKTENVATYNLTTQKVHAFPHHKISLVVNGQEQYRETGSWKIYTAEMTVTFFRAKCSDTADFQCISKLELDGKTKYATNLGISVEVESCGPCKDGAALFENNCYKVISQEADYDTASKDCNRRGDHLVSISSDAENDFVTKLARTNGLSRRNLFIGLKDDNHGKVYTWDNGMNSNYRHWSLYQPSTTSANSCASLGGDGAWYEESCSSKLPYICEKPNSIQTNDNNNNSAHGCLPSWQEFMAACYKLHKLSKRWDDADKHCNGEGARLVEIRNKEENEFVKAVARQQGTNDFYIGLRNSNEQPKTFFWQSGMVLNFTDWAPGEPNGKKAMCGHVYLTNLQWDDMPCHNRLAFICEMPMYRNS
ncbi:hypothetical protein C0Q70_03966 [Pomacea canaliculata]|uniref:C-type lectin domain-containing protein n=2 Tax=Pomacea canaliculata TaxID=400727 RepID=A0A2T7PU67_POMCA|nr:hypothetical protein C0Q70_03966 [Pomacea canaliculata]